MYDSIILSLTGMGFVFVFLLLLVIVTNFMSFIIIKFSNDTKTKASELVDNENDINDSYDDGFEQVDEKILLIIKKAIQLHRK